MSLNSKTFFLALCLIICVVLLLYSIFSKQEDKFIQPSVTLRFNRWALPNHSNAQQLDCYRIVNGDTEYITEMAKNRIRHTHHIHQSLDMSCEAIRSRNYFMDALAENEEVFPFAQARTIYKDYALLELDFAATYSPQNWYCYVLDIKSDALLKRQMRALASCFPNILIGQEREMNSAGKGMAEAYLNCLTMLTNPNRQWKYVSLLQNHDTVIKTRLQIIQILKWLDGANDAEIADPGQDRINLNLNWTVSALTLFQNSKKMAALGSQKISMTKGNVAATLSREMVEYVLKELNLTEMIKRLNQIEFGRDEFLFPTLNSVDMIVAPGGASQICIEKGHQVEQFTRAAIWIIHAEDECASLLTRHGICVLGMEDLGPNLLRWPHIFANKFVSEFDFGASVCWYEALYNRTHFNSHDQQLAMLDQEFYLQLPNVRFQKFKKQKLWSKMKINNATGVHALSHEELMQFECVIKENLKYPLNKNG